MYLLDTNVLSELRKVGAGRCDPHVAEVMGRLPAPELYLSVVTLLEIQQGVLQLERRDRRQAQALQVWLDRFVMPGFENRLLPVDVPVALRCARIHVPDRKPDRDALIAATALVHGMTVVTRNVKDFEPMGVAVLNPWD